MTTPGELNLTEVQGDDWQIELNFIDGSGYAVDFSGSEFTAFIRRSKAKSAPIAALFQIDTDDVDLGVLVLSLGHSSSSELKDRYYYYDLQQIDSDGKYTTLLGGKITLIKEVTTDA
jgi:predicted metalloendopeptidase